MRRPGFDFSRCMSDEQVELLILAPEKLSNADRAHLIAHLCMCSTCKQVAGLLADFYIVLLMDEGNSAELSV